MAKGIIAWTVTIGLIIAVLAAGLKTTGLGVMIVGLATGNTVPYVSTPETHAAEWLLSLVVASVAVIVVQMSIIPIDMALKRRDEKLLQQELALMREVLPPS